MPRLQMFGVAFGSTLAGFLTTFTLLQLHVQAMWLRYGVSVLVAYGVFLLLVRAWMLHYRAHPERLELLRELQKKRPKKELRRERPHRSFGWDVLGDLFEPIFDLEVLWYLLLIVLACVLGVYLFWTIPEWIAELVMDGVVGAALYQRMRNVDQDQWFGSAVKMTAVPFTCLLVLFICAGLACTAYAPEAHSIGAVVTHATHRTNR